ncbi:hypothetical protein DFP72DRAFT_821384, partial [Ephemerocybe angulata]
MIPYTHAFDEYTVSPHRAANYPGARLKFADYHLEKTVPPSVHNVAGHTLYAKIPTKDLGPLLTVVTAKKIMTLHNVPYTKASKKDDLLEALKSHTCVSCDSFLTELSVVPSIASFKADRNRKNYNKRKDATPPLQRCDFENPEGEHTFPPEPVTKDLEEIIAARACLKLRPEAFEERGCAVCGKLTLVSQLTPLKTVKNQLHILEASGCTRKERKSANEKVRELTGPVLDYKCNSICNICRAAVRKGHTIFDTLNNLASYPEDMPPVLVEYVPKGTNKSAADTSVWDNEEEDGTEEGE